MNSSGCPNCNWSGVTLSDQCPNCGFTFNSPYTPQPSQPTIQAAHYVPDNRPLMLDCSACKTPGSMGPDKVPRFSPVVRVIGGILLIPSFLGFGFAALMTLSAILGFSTAPTTRSDAEMAGAAIAGGMIFIFIAIIVIGSLVGGLLGWLLLQNRKVFRCMRCSFVLDRA